MNCIIAQPVLMLAHVGTGFQMTLFTTSLLLASLCPPILGNEHQEILDPLSGINKPFLASYP